MNRVWNEQYRTLYERTLRLLYDAGIDLKLADELATQRALAAALKQREQSFGRGSPSRRQKFYA